MDEKNNLARVSAPDDQLSLAIGRDGQNARLTAKLTGWRVEVEPQVLVEEVKVTVTKKVKTVKSKPSDVKKKGKKSKDKDLEEETENKKDAESVSESSSSENTTEEKKVSAE